MTKKKFAIRQIDKSWSVVYKTDKGMEKILAIATSRKAAYQIVDRLNLYERLEAALEPFFDALPFNPTDVPWLPHRASLH